MSASEASLYKAVGSFDLSGQSSPLTVSNSKIELGSEVLAFLKTERGTVSGVSIQNIQQGSFQAVFNVANDSIYSYLCVPPVYKFYADENPINPVNPTERTINFIGNASTTPSTLSASQSYVVGAYTIEAGRTCTFSNCVFDIRVLRTGSVAGTVDFNMYEGASLIEQKSISVGGGTGVVLLAQGFLYTPSLFSTTGSSRTFRLELVNNIASGATIVLYDGTLSPPIEADIKLTAKYS